MKKKKNNNKYISFLREGLTKFFVVLIAFSVLGASNINQTYAYFSDTAIISGSTFTAGTLGINVNSQDSFNSGLMYPGDSSSTFISISNTGTLNSQYTAKTRLSGSDTTACDYVTMTATSQTSSPYSGRIKDFKSVATATVDTAWNFNFTVDANAPASVWGKTCYFNWKYTAWQENLFDSSLGFSSTKEKLGEIKIGNTLVMNEILPNPEGLDTQSGLQGEWVEIYNNSNSAINISGWKIKDLANHEKVISSANTWNGRTLIGAKGSGLEWVVVFMNDDIMNNGGDTISFYDPLNNLVDRYIYTGSANDADSDSNSTGGASNTNPSGSETAGNEGKSYARRVDGTGAWVDPVPTPGLPNELAYDNEYVQEYEVINGTALIVDKDQGEIADKETIKSEEEGTVASEELLLSEEILQTQKDEVVVQEEKSTALTGVISDIMGDEATEDTEEAKTEETVVLEEVPTISTEPVVEEKTGEEPKKELAKKEPVTVEKEVDKEEPKEEMAKEEPANKEEIISESIKPEPVAEEKVEVEQNS